MSDEAALRLAPTSWRRWVADGARVLPRLKRSVARMRVVRASDQVPKQGTREWHTLNAIYRHYKGSEALFERLAASVAERVLRGEGADYRHGWLSRASGDRGWDFVGRLDVGSDFARARLVVLGQAKCEKLGVATGGPAIARTVARLRRGWLGVYVTTGYVSESVQEEVFEDQYPLVLIHRLRVAREVMALLTETGMTLDDFLASVDDSYEVAPQRADEILLQD